MLCRAQILIDLAWQRMSERFLPRYRACRVIHQFPDLSAAHAAKVAADAKASLRELDALELDILPHQVALSIKVLQFQLGIEAQAAERYWLACEYGDWPAMFPVGPYGSGSLFSAIRDSFSGFRFSQQSDCDRYLALLQEYIEYVAQIRVKLEEQAGRGIRIPQPALPSIRAMLRGQAEASAGDLNVSASRLCELPAPSDFVERVAFRIQERLKPAFAELLDALGPEYEARAPLQVGLRQFKDGEHIYETLVAQHSSLRASAAEVHKAGQEHILAVEGEMRAIRESLGYRRREEFHHFLQHDVAWTARSAEEMQSRLEEAARRVEPMVHRYFHSRPAANWRIARLDPALERGMTYGFYQKPSARQPEGIYYYNGLHLSGRTLATEPARIFHELIPGHHFHMARQGENDLLHPLRKRSSFNAFNEGWAEYAAALAGEMGLYVNPCERYGRLLMDAFTSARLVVDTGLNALGWSLDRAQQYLREHTILSDTEIESETLRYATDIPGQSVAYKLGEQKMMDLRHRTQKALGSAFDIRDFHEIVIGSGAMPLEVLEWHVERNINRLVSLAPSAKE